MTFILKLGKADYTDLKSFRSVSLSNLFLKKMEKVVKDLEWSSVVGSFTSKS